MTKKQTTSQKIPKLRFSEFSGEWEEKKLGEVADLTSSKRVYLKDYVKSGIPFYRGKEISELKKNIIPKNILYITEQSYNDFKTKYGVPRKDDILITAVGTLGNVLKVRNNDKFYFKDGNLIWFKNINESSNFLEISLDYNKRKILKSSIGSSQKALTIVSLNKIKLNFPQLPEQQKIASFFSSVDEKIESLKKKKELFEEYKKGVMQKIFKQEIRFKDKKGETFGEWEEKKLGEVGKIITGKTPSTSNKDLWDGDIQFITPTDINEGEKYQFKTNRYVKNTGKLFILPSKSIIYTCIASIGKMSLSLKPAITNQQINSIVPNNNTNSEYLYYYLLYLTPKIKSVQANTTLPIINKTDFSKFKILLPSLPEQEKIAEFLGGIDDKIERVGEEIERSEEFKKGLLQGMFV